MDTAKRNRTRPQWTKKKNGPYNPSNISLKYFSSIESNGTQGHLKYHELKCRRVKIKCYKPLPLPEAAWLFASPRARVPALPQVPTWNGVPPPKDDDNDLFYKTWRASQIVMISVLFCHQKQVLIKCSTSNRKKQNTKAQGKGITRTRIFYFTGQDTVECDRI
jgi:hypothetical protein